MSFNGGAIDFKFGVVVSDAIQEILTDKDSTIDLLTKNPYTPAYLFTLTFNNSKFSKYFKKLPGTNIPRVLLLKLMAYEFLTYSLEEGVTIDKNEFTNESKQHINLTNSTKTFPICPSFLYSEDTTVGFEKYTPIGKSINILLKKVDMYSYITRDMIKKLTHRQIEKNLSLGITTKTDDVELGNISQHIIIMEYYSCITLKKFIEDIYYKGPRIYYIYGIKLPIMGTEAFGCILTLFVTLLMLERGFIHGDLHQGNILLCVDDANEQNINPVVIDFGRTSRLRFESKFDNENLIRLMSIIKIVEDKKLKREKLDDLKVRPYLLKSYKLHPYFRDLYDNTLKIISPDKLPDINLPAMKALAATLTIAQSPQLRVTPLSTYVAPKLTLEPKDTPGLIQDTDDIIATHIENLLRSELYVEAAIVSSMCCLPSFNHSIFYFYVDSHLRRENSSYRSMYYCKSENKDKQLLIWNSYDILLKDLLEARLQRQLLFEAEQQVTRTRQRVTRGVMNTFVNVVNRLTSSGRPRMAGLSKLKRTKRTKRTRRTRRTRRKSRR